MNFSKNRDLPFSIHLSFELLQKQYKSLYKVEKNKVTKSYYKMVLDCFDQYPALTTGLSTTDQLDKLKDPVATIMSPLFPESLTNNEIKSATVPFNPLFFHQSNRFDQIINDAGDDYNLKLMNLSDDELYVMTCSFILLKNNYKFNYLNKPLYYTIPNKNGDLVQYRMVINGDYIDIEPTKKAIEITPEVVNTLLRNELDIELWKKYIPPNSWKLKGFLLINFIDITVDTIISDLMSEMIRHTASSNDPDSFQMNFQRLFSSHDVQIGFSSYDSDTNALEHDPSKPMNGLILGDQSKLKCKDVFSPKHYNELINNRGQIVIPDIDLALEKEKSHMLKSLQDKGIKSCLIASIVVKDSILALMEIVSPNANDLNSINVKLLEPIMPFIQITAERSHQETVNYSKAIIQSECTSIHPSVLWKFEEEAGKFIEASFSDEPHNAVFNDIVFEHVIPLFGQIDIVSSSTIRNEAIMEDLVKQLDLAKNIFQKALKEEQLMIYEQLILKIGTYISSLNSPDEHTTSEEELLLFLKSEVNPIMAHVQYLTDELSAKVDNYQSCVNQETGIIHNKRKSYEQAVQNINLQMASLLDSKQKDAQQLYPHFFERFKTDGVEHNMYIGQSLVKNKRYDPAYLKNLRLWQLVTMCDMEREFYTLQKDTKLSLSCASLVFVYSTSLSIRYRIDEKRFDVDGAYNARYEIIKKRIDKAHIKGTRERITQKGKLVIVYSQKKDELEYMRYIQYLQSKNYLADKVERVELEDLQGVVGLKAVRADIVYDTPDEGISYDDLIGEIKSTAVGQ